MEMAKIGPGIAGGSRRLALTDEDKQGRELFTQWCADAGCQIKIDDMGNMFATRSGNKGDIAPVTAGSHLDTQPHGGKFDGVYGVLAALEVIRTLNDHGIETHAPVEIVNWTNEEGARFAPAMISSGVYAGLFEKSFAWNRTDVDGKSLKSELERIGYLGEEPCGQHKIGYLLEAHIEQGPILENERKPIGVVTGGQGQRWYDISIAGQDSHAGSTPMPGRKDALVAASNIVAGMQKIANDHPPHGVCTVGEMHVEPNSRNTIPGHIQMTLDIRNPDQGILDQMTREVEQLCHSAAAEQRCELMLEQIWDCPPIVFNEDCIDAVRSAAEHLDLPNMKMVSGAGHDACQASHAIATSMIFVPCEGGLSHNEAEYATPDDLTAGANVLLHAMLALSSLRQ